MTEPDGYLYPGGELALFRGAVHWKALCKQRLSPFISGDVLEVGAGIGGSSRWLCTLPHIRSWLALEPDAGLLEECRRNIAEVCLVPWEVRVGTLDCIAPERRFDTLLYLDVLEHISEDRAELRRASELLHPGGRLVILAPAHPRLYTPFDAAIGHYRRYTRGSLTAVVPNRLQVEWLGYLDSAGLLASLANRLLLHQELPGPRQIRFWDSWLVPVSRRCDWLTGYRVGKTVLGVWRREVPAFGGSG